MTNWGFEPSPYRGRALSEGMRRDFLGSLQYLSTRASSDDLSRLLSQFVARCATGSASGISPSAFGLYFEIAEAMLGGDENLASEAASTLVQLPAIPPGLQVLGRGLPEAQLLDRILDARLGLEAGDFASIRSSDLSEFVPRLQAGMKLIQEGAPSLHGELEAILSQVLVAKAPEGAAESFDGASHYQFWGLLLLNPSYHPTRLAMAEVLAHESGHSILFGLTREEPLALNSDDELYPSPLRMDARPMDGILHATYVCARMAWTMEALMASGQLTSGEMAEAREAAARDRDLFAKGMVVVREHANLTDTGRSIMDGASQWMNASNGVSVAIPI